MLGSIGKRKLLSKTKDVEKARRLARTIISDIAIYNPEKVEKGIVEDSLFQILDSEFKEGYTFYRESVDDSILLKHSFFDNAILDIILQGYSYINSDIW